MLVSWLPSFSWWRNKLLQIQLFSFATAKLKFIFKQVIFSRSAAHCSRVINPSVVIFSCFVSLCLSGRLTDYQVSFWGNWIAGQSSSEAHARVHRTRVQSICLSVCLSRCMVRFLTDSSTTTMSFGLTDVEMSGIGIKLANRLTSFQVRARV